MLSVTVIAKAQVVCQPAPLFTRTSCFKSVKADLEKCKISSNFIIFSFDLVILQFVCNYPHYLFLKLSCFAYNASPNHLEINSKEW